MPEVVLSFDVSQATADRHWTYGRAWLYAELAGEDGQEKSKKN
jgi:hypothetical protein